jgi:hypothetical protein
MAMLDWVEVDVVDMLLQVLLITNAMFPVASLPDAPLTLEVA